MQVLLRASPRRTATRFFARSFALTDSVLGVRNAEPADSASGEVRDRGDVTGAPGIRDDLVIGSDTEVGARDEAAAFFDREVGVAHDLRVRHDACGPDDEVGLEGLTG